jgi:uncharacterized membrane protein
MGTTLRRLKRSVQKVAKVAGLDPAETKLATDVVVGISERGSCHLSEIGRALDEPGPLIATERRLSEGLSDPDSNLDAMRVGWLRSVAPIASKMPFVVGDIVDLSKPYGKAFEHLDTVRDASDKRKELEPGFWCMQIEATDEQHRNLPLYHQVFSTKRPGYPGWWETIERAILQVVARVGRDAVWLFDRGFDAVEFLGVLTFLKLHWVVRQMQTRNVVLGDGKVVGMHEVVLGLRKPHATELPYVCKKTHVVQHRPVRFGYCPIGLPDLPGRFWLVVITGLREEDVVLLTNTPLRTALDAEHIVLAYVRRWGCEEGTRCWKQKTRIEDFRVRCWESIDRLTFLAMLAYGIQALWLLTRRVVAASLIARVKVFIEHVLFLHYRLWDGVTDALRADE